MTGGTCTCCKLIGLLAAIGAVNWGVIAAFQVDLVAKVLGPMTTASRIVYGLIGLAGLGTLAAVLGIKCPCCCKDTACGTKT